jgi:tetratricopeptide (TPR) repeat protein
MRKQGPSLVSASGTASIAIGGAATNCQFITNVNATTSEPISSSRFIRLPFLPLNERFAGREAILRDLTNLLSKANAKAISQPISLYSDGGIGKSTLAVELAWRLYESQRFHYVFFLTASTPDTLENSIAELCDPVVQIGNESSPAQIPARREAVLRWLQVPKRAARTLIIFDSADSPKSTAAVRSLLPKLPHCAKLITSRNVVWDDTIAFELPVFTASESQRFLVSCLRVKEPISSDIKTALDEIATAVDNLPLALEIVSSYIRKKRLPFTDWLGEWQRNPRPVVTHEDPARIRYGREKGDYPVSLAYVWKQSVADLSEGTRKYLNVLSLMLAPRPAIFPIAKARAQWTGTTEAISELSEASLLSWHLQTDDISMHRVLQVVTRIGHSDSEKSSSLFVAALVLNSILPEPEWDEAAWRYWEQLAPHVESLLGHLEDQRAEFVRGLGLGILNRYGLWLANNAQYESAEHLFRRAIATAEKAAGPETAEMGACLNNLGKVLHERNRLSEAEPLYRRALAITESACGLDDPEVAVRLSNLGALLLATQRLTEAEPMLRRALEIDEKHFGASDPKVARDLNNLSAFMRFANRLDEAEELLRRGVSMNRQSLSLNHPDLATLVNNLGEVLMAQGRLEEATPLLREALQMIRNSLGMAHPTYATGLHNIAITLESVGRVKEAESLLQEGIAITEKSLGPDHINIATYAVRLSGLYQTQGLLDQAEALARRALKIDEESLGSDHPSVARDLNALAMALRNSEHQDAALDLLRRALTIDEKHFGAAHPDTAVTMFNLASCLAKGADDTAEDFYRRALLIFETDPVRNKANLANCLEALGQFLLDRKRLEEAESLFRRTLRLSQTGPLIKPSEIARKSNNLGDLLWSAGRLNEGEPFIREGLLILHRIGLLSGTQHRDFPGVLQNYLGVQIAMGTPQTEALKTTEELLRADTVRLAEHLTKSHE